MSIAGVGWCRHSVSWPFCWCPAKTLADSYHSQLSGMTKGKLANLETGRQTQSAADIAGLLEVYGAEQRSIIRLTALAERTAEATRWTPWAGAIPPWFTVFVGLERLADRAFV